MRRSKSSKSNVKRPLTTFITLSSGDRAGVAQVAVEAVVGRRRQQHLAAGRRERAQRGDQAGMHAGGDVQQRRIDVDAVAPLVPGDDALRETTSGMIDVAPDRRASSVPGAPAVIARRGAEIHVGDAHARDDVILVGEAGVDRAVPLGRIGADAAVRRVEIELGRIRGRDERRRWRLLQASCLARPRPRVPSIRRFSGTTCDSARHSVTCACSSCDCLTLPPERSDTTPSPPPAASNSFTRSVTSVP